MTYSEMITKALESLPNKVGTFKQICDKLEKAYSSALNWKPESEVRKSPVWKSSVRKILLSNAKFQKTDDNSYRLVF